jgi:hypothetical protein
MSRLTAGNACSTSTRPRNQPRPGKLSREIAYAAMAETVTTSRETPPANSRVLRSTVQMAGLRPTLSVRKRQFSSVHSPTGVMPWTRVLKDPMTIQRYPTTMGSVMAASRRRMSHQDRGLSGIS